MDTSSETSEVGETSPLQVLQDFICAMNKWETECWEASHQDNVDLESIQYIEKPAMENIFSVYCTPKKRPYGRNGSFRHPPEYDPQAEKVLAIVSESKRRIVIYTEQGSGFRFRCKYVLLRIKKKWLIDSKQIQIDEKKWQRTFL